MIVEKMLLTYGFCGHGRMFVLSDEFPYIHFVKFNFGVGKFRVIKTPIKIDWYKWFPKLKDIVRYL